MGYSSELRAQRFAKLIVAIIIIILIVGVFVAVPDSDTFSTKEIRLYVWLFFLCFILTIVALVSIRNAQVMNTAYLIKLREQMHMNGKSIDEQTKYLRTLIDTNKKLIKTIEHEKDIE